MCGFRPTGHLHLGHYFSVIKPGLEGAEVLVANYHAPQETESSIEVLRKYGVKRIRLQKETFDAELFFKLMSIAPIGYLERMTQYRSSEDKNAHLLTYPVLMTHDVANYSEVVVGEDQKQHLNFARFLLNKYNKQFKENLGIPVANVMGGRIKDLNNPESKMSKSNPKGCLFLDDSPEQIVNKIRKANTNPEGMKNLVFLYKKFVGEDVPLMNLELKEKLSSAIISMVGV